MSGIESIHDDLSSLLLAKNHKDFEDQNDLERGECNISHMILEVCRQAKAKTSR